MKNKIKDVSVRGIGRQRYRRGASWFDSHERKILCFWKHLGGVNVDVYGWNLVGINQCANTNMKCECEVFEKNGYSQID